MSKHGAVILSNIRQLLRRSNVRQFECCGLRLAPVTTTLATLHFWPGHEQQQHRTFSSSTHSDDDKEKLRKNLEKQEKPSPTAGEDFGRLNLSDLKALLRARGLSVTGKKQTLIERLKNTTATTTAATTTTTTIVSADDPTTPIGTTGTSSHLSSPGSWKRPSQALPLVNNTATNASSTPSSSSACGNASTLSQHNDDVSLEYINGMPHLTVRLPSRNELCQFALKPISHTVGNLLTMLREEDRGIDRAAVINKHGVRIASSCTIERLLDDEFSLTFMMEINPHSANEKKMELFKKAERRTNMMTWVGLGLMSVQFGILARLTWWEYSWDIMEPVTYFVTYGTTMAMYAYYCVTKREYIMENVYNRQYSLNIYKNAKKVQFDVEHYNRLKRRSAELEYNLRRLNDPINMGLPAHLVRTQLDSPPIEESNGTEKCKEKST
ncbi:uncharacterized protein Dvir_GJ13377 [Drosophila virilis]|uniref:Calcium uniporter protein n=1 Tax=Drosophila virilis TaxID=7244 RepID=B4LIB1_DROVI|nr:uncharacterized protein Dvir_GJ13377 [Drosophila virilis]